MLEGEGREGKEEEASRFLWLLLHPSRAPPAPALQLVPLSFPPQLIIVTDYLTASPTVTCFGLTDYAIWATSISPALQPGVLCQRKAFMEETQREDKTFVPLGKKKNLTAAHRQK